MRKIVLAQLSKEDSEKIFSCERNLSTFQTLLENQFITELDKRKIIDTIPLLISKTKGIYKEILQNYEVPYTVNFVYHVDVETDELYVEVY